MLKLLLGDSNQSVVILAIRIVKLLAGGLRRQFAQSARQLFAQLLIKFRERKTSLIEETKGCLLSLLQVLYMEDVVEDVKDALGDKAHLAKLNTL